MIDYDTHKLIMLAAGLPESAFVAQRELLVNERDRIKEDLCTLIKNVPVEVWARHTPEEVKAKLIDAIKGRD